VGIAEVARPGFTAGGEVRERVLTLPDRFRPEAANGFSAEFALTVDDEHYRIALSDGRCSVREENPTAPVARISTDARTWLALDAGALSGIDAFLDDRLEVRGNVDYAVRMQSLFHPSERARTSQDLEHVTVHADGLELSAFAFGQGPPVVLLHGMAATKLSYLPLLPALAERYTVIVPDLPGHGESAKPRVRYTPPYFARVIRALFDEMGLRDAAVVGNSMGGRIALEVATRHSHRVNSLILLDPAAAGLPFPLYARLLGLLPTGVGAIPVPWRKRIVVTAIRQMFAAPERLPRAGYLAAADEFIRIYRKGRARMALLSAMRGLIADEPEAFWLRAKRISVPTLILWGREDRLVPVGLGHRLANTIPDSRLEVLPGVGHVPQFEHPEETRRLVLEFLDEVNPPRWSRPPAA
jgi:pimeloyl-ACP methyl ester carboxylesterase/putative sterol carrier protein